MSVDALSAALAGMPARLALAAPGALVAGQVLQARVVAARGNSVTLRWGDEELRVATRVPLAVGQSVRLLVEEAAGGTLRLRLMDDGLAGLAAPPRAGPAVPVTAPDGPAGQTSARGGVRLPIPPAPGSPRETDGGAPRGPGGERSAADGNELLLGGARAFGADPASGGGLAPGVLLRAAALPAYARLRPGPAAGETLPLPDAPPAAAEGEVGLVGGQGVAAAPAGWPGAVVQRLLQLGLSPEDLAAIAAGMAPGHAPTVAGAASPAAGVSLAATGGGRAEARAAALLATLRLPATAETLSLARNLLAGGHQPRQTWAQALATLQRLAQGASPGPEAGVAGQAHALLAA